MEQETPMKRWWRVELSARAEKKALWEAFVLATCKSTIEPYVACLHQDDQAFYYAGGWLCKGIKRKCILLGDY